MTRIRLTSTSRSALRSRMARAISLPRTLPSKDDGWIL